MFLIFLRGRVHNLDSLKKELSNNNPAKKAQTHNKSNVGKHPMLRFLRNTNWLANIFSFTKKPKWKFSLNLCLGYLTVQEIKV